VQQSRVERASFEASRAERRYRAVDPDDRLVARGLERAWEQCLSALGVAEACKIACNNGSDALLVMLASPEADDAGLQEIELPTAVHLPLDELELADLPLGLTVGPSRSYRGADGGDILCDAVGE